MSKNPSIDLLKGVLILLVMVGHLMELTGTDHLALWVGSGFRMPLMIGISGYLLNLKRVRHEGAHSLFARYGQRLLLPWAIAVIVYVSVSHWNWSWATPLDLLLRPPFHLWYVPVLFFLILIARLLPFPPLTMLMLGTPFSLAIMYGFGLAHGPVADNILAVDSRFLRYPIYFFFGMLMAEHPHRRSNATLALLVALLGLTWWMALKASGNNIAYVPARLLMCLGLIALLPHLSALRLSFAPLNIMGRNSLFFYLWHPMVMALVMMSGLGALGTLLASAALLYAASYLVTAAPLIAVMTGGLPKRGTTFPRPAAIPLG